MLTSCRNTGTNIAERQTQRVPGHLPPEIAQRRVRLWPDAKALASPYAGLDKSSAFNTGVAKQTPP